MGDEERIQDAATEVAMSGGSVAERVKALNGLAREALAARFPHQSEQIFRCAHRMDPTDLDALVGLAEAELRAQRAHKALALLEHGRRLTYEPPFHLLFALGRAQLATRNQRAGEETLRQALQIAPNASAKVFVLLTEARSAIAEGRISAARDSVVRALRLHKNHREAKELLSQLDRTLALAEAGTDDGASSVARALGLFRKVQHQLEVPHADRNASRVSRAVRFLTEALQHLPEHPVLNLAAGDLALRQRSFSEAERRLASALRQLPPDPRLFAAHGQAAFHRGALGPARARFQHAVTLAPADDFSRLALAQIAFREVWTGTAERTELLDASRTQLEAVLEQGQEIDRAHARLGLAYLALVDDDAARARKLLETCPPATSDPRTRLLEAGVALLSDDARGAQRMLAAEKVLDSQYRRPFLRVLKVLAEGNVEPQAYRAYILAADIQQRLQPHELGAFLLQDVSVTIDVEAALRHMGSALLSSLYAPPPCTELWLRRRDLELSSVAA